MKVVGIDVGSYSVKVADLDVSSKGYTLAHFIERPLSPDATKDKSLEIIEIIRSITAEFDPNTTRFVIGVPQHMVSVHHKRFPFRERPKIAKSLAFELEDEIPLDIDETIFDAKVTEYIGDTANVLTVACPGEAVADTLSLAKDGGFDPEIVSVEGLALANCFEAWDLAPPEATVAARQDEDVTTIGVTTTHPARIILNIGHTRTILLVYRENSLVAVRSILWGGADVASAISRAFSVPAFEAVKVLQAKSFILINSAGASRDQLLMSKTVSEAVDELVRELRLTLLEVRSAFNLNYTHIELLGGASQIQNLGPYLTQALEVPANIGHHLAAHKSIRFEATPHIESASALAIGLALEALKRPRNPPVNLRKGEFARENVTFKRFWETWRVPAQVGLSIFVLAVVFSVVRDTLSLTLVESVDTRLSEVAAKVAGLKGAEATATGVSRYIKRQKTAIKNRETLMQLDNYSSSMDALARLSEKLPVTNPPIAGKGLSVHRLVVDNEDLIIEGKAEGPGLITAIEAALKDIARPQSFAKTNPGPLPPGPGTPFAYKLKINRRP